MLNIYLRVQKDADKREFTESLKRAYKKLPDADKWAIKRVLLRMGQVDGLRAMTLPDALELLAKIGLVLDDGERTTRSAAP